MRDLFFYPQRKQKGLELIDSRCTDMLTRYRKHEGDSEPLCGRRSLTLSPCLAKFKPSCSSAPGPSPPPTDLCKHLQAPAGGSGRQSSGLPCGIMLMSQPQSERQELCRPLHIKTEGVISFTIFIQEILIPQFC